MSREERARVSDLLVRAADGDRSAFDPLFDALWPILRSFAAKTLPEADAEDAAQEAMVKVFAQLADFDRGRDATAWALTIAGFEVLSVRRRRLRRREDAPPGDGLPSSAPSPEDDALRGELLRVLEAHLGTVSDADRGALVDALRGDAAPSEAARKQRWRAVDRLRAFWRSRHG